MAGKVQSYETTTAKRGPKNTLLGVKEVPLLMWQLTNRKGEIQTELGFEIVPGQIRKIPADLYKQSNPVNDKLQKLLFAQLHPDLAEAAEDKPAAAPLGRTPREVAAAKLPKDVDVVGDVI